MATPQAIPSELRSYIDNVRSEPVAGAVIGPSGAGKSTFINTWRQLQFRVDQPFYPTDPVPDCPHKNCRGHSLPAPTNAIECTKLMTPYVDPTSPNIVLWDVPGIGTGTFPRDTYFDIVPMHTFDFIIIMTRGRFTELDSLIVNKCKELHKPFFFVRNGIQADIEENMECGVLAETTCETVRRECIRNLHDPAPVFLISGLLRHKDRFEFPALILAITTQLPLIKHDAVLMAVQSFSKEVLQAKKKVMERRAMFYAAASAGVGAAPLPGLSIVADISMIVAMSIEAQTLYGLDEGRLKNIVKGVGLDVLLRDVSSFVGRSAVISLLRKYAALTTVEEAVKLIPVVGSILGAAISGGTTFYTCRTINEGLYENAMKVSDMIMDQIARSEA